MLQHLCEPWSRSRGSELTHGPPPAVSRRHATSAPPNAVAVLIAPKLNSDTSASSSPDRPPTEGLGASSTRSRAGGFVAQARSGRRDHRRGARRRRHESQGRSPPARRESARIRRRGRAERSAPPRATSAMSGCVIAVNAPPRRPADGVRSAADRRPSGRTGRRCPPWAIPTAPGDAAPPARPTRDAHAAIPAAASRRPASSRACATASGLTSRASRHGQPSSSASTCSQSLRVALATRLADRHPVKVRRWDRRPERDASDAAPEPSSREWQPGRAGRLRPGRCAQRRCAASPAGTSRKPSPGACPPGRPRPSPL